VSTTTISDGGSSVLKGALAGAVATGAMSGVMFAAQRAGLMGRMPPHKITRAALRWVRPWTASTGKTKGLASLGHLAFGMVAGALYGGLAGRLGDRRPSLGGGLGFGTLVWLTSYAGWLPKLGLMPPPHRDRPGRQPSMLLAHLVYGVVLSRLARRA
jgi:hypothetical protein